MTDWHVGQRVVCINDKLSHVYVFLRKAGRVFPKRGVVYVVREVLLYEFAEGPDVAIRLVEIVNPIDRWDDGYSTELAFWVGRFRPVVEPESEMAKLEAILGGVEKQEPVDA